MAEFRYIQNLMAKAQDAMLLGAVCGKLVGR